MSHIINFDRYVMEEALKREKWCKRLLFACGFLYMCTMSLKTAYSSQLVAISEDLGGSKVRTSIGLIFFYVVYSIVQCLVSFNKNKINVNLFMIITGIGTSVVYALTGIINAEWQIWVILLLGGVFQAGIWLLLMSVLKKYLPEKYMSKIVVVMSITFTLGTILSISVGALCVEVASWKLTFVILAVINLISVLIFVFIKRYSNSILACYYDENIAKEHDEQVVVKEFAKKSKVGFYAYYMLIMLFAVILTGLVSSWVPNLLYEEYDFPKSLSMIVTLIPLLVGLTGPSITCFSCKNRNTFLVSICFLTVSALFALFIALFYDRGMILVFSLYVLFSLIAGNVRTIYSSYYPLQIKNSVNYEVFIAMINVSANLATAFGPFIGALIQENFGWEYLYLTSTVLAVITALIIIPKTVKSFKTKSLL